ncbi:MAG: hypothetical protein VX366_00450 [Candidatus Thermoplasmatota archaeon]|nr:hypothetical protein [Candidatus Thermoplasmatota archaeon]
MGRERMLAIVLASLLFVIAPSAIADDENLSLTASIDNLPDKGWFSSGDVVEISAELANNGDSTSITVDPSCNEVLKIWKDSQLIIDGSLLCNGQSRGLDIDSNSVTSLQTLTWDLKDINGEFVSSGDYTIQYFVAGEELSSFVQLHVQTPVEIPDGLEMDVLVTSRTGAHSENSPSIVTVRLQNTLNQEINTEFGECKIEINSVLFGSCGPSSMSSKEIVTVEQIPIDLVSGNNEIVVSLGDGSLTRLITLEATADDDVGVWEGDYSNLELSLQVEDDYTYGEMENLEASVTITNVGNEDVTLDFSNSCRGEYWAIDQSGNVLTDTRALKDCNDLDVENILTPNSQRSYSQPDWVFIDTQGCHVSPGEILIVLEIPEHDLYSTQEIQLTRDRDSYCSDDLVTISADITGEETLLVSPYIVSNTEFEVTFSTMCGLKTSLYDDESEINSLLSQCSYTELVTLASDEMELELIEFDMSGLEDGEYTLFFETSTYPRITSSVSFIWPMQEGLDDEQQVEDEDSAEIITRTLSGTWSVTSNENGECWLLNSVEEGLVTLSGAPSIISWAPKSGLTGQYQVYNSEASPQCSDFIATSITIKEIYSESMPEIEQQDEEEEVVLTAPEQQEAALNPVVISVGVVVASSGILSLLVALIATNESWRIPTTTAGLWLLGLVGRTSETSDGRYQRGRLMGYLTANPGCHFRALMAALEMSNGQITHHLKILEDEDRIWRRPDGRLVRFYPFTNNLHPGLEEDELPLPPLSPDPNSLQGKILRLLDDDGQMKKFPTQAELAHRLDRSQQLVSHHLRTLQKFGLVEKRKKGVKHRYCLTKEAMFLLDTTEI